MVELEEPVIAERGERRGLGGVEARIRRGDAPREFAFGEIGEQRGEDAQRELVVGEPDERGDVQIGVEYGIGYVQPAIRGDTASYSLLACLLVTKPSFARVLW